MIRAILILALFIFPLIASAGGPFIVSPESGKGSFWNKAIIPLHPEAGVCGDSSNEQIITLLEESVSAWTEVDGIDFTFNIITNPSVFGQNANPDTESIYFFTNGFSIDIDANNHRQHFNSELRTNNNIPINEFNTVVFDDDGGIVRDVFGQNAEFVVLGLAGPHGFAADNDGSTYQFIRDGQALVNCNCFIADNVVPTQRQVACEAALGDLLTEEDIEFTIIHEIGHFLGLDHSQVFIDQIELTNDNGAITIDSCADNNQCAGVPTMFPLSVVESQQITLHKDDQVAIQSLYAPETLVNDYCTLQGVVTANVNNQIRQLRCVDIQALVLDENSNIDAEHSISTVSGYYSTYDDENRDGELQLDEACIDCGAFILSGLDPGQTYTIRMRPIYENFTGPSRVGPCHDNQLETFADREIEYVDVTQYTCDNAGDSDTLPNILIGGLSGEFDNGSIANNVDGNNPTSTNDDPADASDDDPVDVSDNDPVDVSDDDPVDVSDDDPVDVSDDDPVDVNDNPADTDSSSSGGGGGGCSLNSHLKGMNISYLSLLLFGLIVLASLSYRHHLKK